MPLKEKSDIPIYLNVFNLCLFPVLTYEVDTLTPNRKNINKIEIAQRAMVRSMLNIFIRDRVSNHTIKKRSRVTGAIDRLTKLK